MCSCKRLISKGTQAVLPVLFVALMAASNKEYFVSTLAGGVPPPTSVKALAASIGSLAGVQTDSLGNVYVSSIDLHCVFKVDSAGTLTRVAGACRPGYSGDGGPAVNAQLHDPMGLAVDPNGALYIADSFNHVVRKVLRDGTITTVAGNGTPGFSGDGGPATRAQLANPQTIAIDAGGNLYIAGYTRRIRRVSTDGTITTMAGNGTPGDAGDGGAATSAQVDFPGHLVVDGTGNLYISDTSHNKVRKVSVTGTISTVVGSGTAGYTGDGGPAISAQLSGPQGLAIDREGNLYIADSGNYRIRKVSATGTITTVAGNGEGGASGDGGPAIIAAMMPMFLAVDTSGNVYIAGGTPIGTGWGRLRRISTSGIITTVAGNGCAYSGDRMPATRAQLFYPGSMAVDHAGSLYIADGYNWRIRKVTPKGIITTVAGNGTCCDSGDGGPAVQAQIWNYCHLALDAKGNLYISQTSHAVRKVSSKGIITTVAGTSSAGFAGDGGPASLAQLNYPQGIALDSAGNLYIADMQNERVRRIAADGTISTVAGNGTPGHGGDGGPAVSAELNHPGELAVDSNGNLYILEYQDSRIRKVSPAGIISTIAVVPEARSFTVDAAGTLYVAADHSVFRLSPQGRPEVIAGTGDASYSGDGGPALDAHFSRLGGIAVDRTGRIYVSDGNAVRMLRSAPRLVQDSVAQGPSDLRVELRSATGSNRFQIGEVIPLQFVLSISTPKRYLEPCKLFDESHFGFPQCRFVTPWSFTIRHPGGWVDLTQEFPSPGIFSGPTFEVPNRDLSTEPVVFSSVLTHKFRFDMPGEYRVLLSMDIGLDDETTQRKPAPGPAVQPHAVKVRREIVLQIVPARPKWQAEIIRRGYEAYSGPVPRSTNPLSPEFRQYQEATEALCNLGSEDAARVLARLLSRDHRKVETCLEHTPSAPAAIEELQRLLVDPDVAISPEFFRVLVLLLSRDESRIRGLPVLSQQHVDSQRERLSAALPQKRGEAQIASLLTVLAYPPRPKSTASQSSYSLPFAPSMIASVVANYDRFPGQSQEWLLDDGWDRVRSPLMLPVVRRRAIAGDGQALLRWRELAPTEVTVFLREEVVRPVPRFSSFYLRLPEGLMPGQEPQIATNFVGLTQENDLVRAATLLHRYATGAVLQSVLPFIDAKRAEWPCSIQVPVLAYLLKASPAHAAPRLEQALNEVHHGACHTNEFFTNIGFLEPSPVLERLALAQIDRGTEPLARDAVEYLRRYGSTTTKPLLRDRLVNWRLRFVSSGAEKRWNDGVATSEDRALAAMLSALGAALIRAQAWVLSLEELKSIQAQLGNQAAKGCCFETGVDAAPGDYTIQGRTNDRWGRKPSPMEYLNPAEPLHYSINQYVCIDMKALKEKILQLPAGSTFTFAWDSAAAGRDELVEISDFLWSHGYKVRNPQNWSFLRPDPKR
jgi:sugar lactone lactonase YvrE